MLYLSFFVTVTSLFLQLPFSLSHISDSSSPSLSLSFFFYALENVIVRGDHTDSQFILMAMISLCPSLGGYHESPEHSTGSHNVSTPPHTTTTTQHILNPLQPHNRHPQKSPPPPHTGIPLQAPNGGLAVASLSTRLSSTSHNSYLGPPLPTPVPAHPLSRKLRAGKEWMVKSGIRFMEWVDGVACNEHRLSLVFWWGRNSGRVCVLVSHYGGLFWD